MSTIPVRVEQPAGTSSTGSGTLEGAWGEESESSRRGILGGRVVDIDVEKLSDNLDSLTSNLAQVFRNLKAVGGYELQEVQVAVEVNASGGVNLIGNLTAGAKGALTLTFAPPSRTVDANVES